MPLSQSEADALLQMPKEFVDADPLESMNGVMQPLSASPSSPLITHSLSFLLGDPAYHARLRGRLGADGPLTLSALGTWTCSPGP